MDKVIFGVVLLLMAAQLSVISAFDWSEMVRVKKEEDRTDYCNNLISDAVHCPSSRYPLLQQLQSNDPRAFLGAVRRAGVQSICEQSIGYQKCMTDMSVLAVVKCGDVPAVWAEARSMLSLAIIYKSVLTKACMGSFGNLDEHLRCFTNYNLIMSGKECLNRGSTGRDAIIDCVTERIKNTADCQPGADHVMAAIAEFYFDAVDRQSVEELDEGRNSKR